jgi:hypothetical protein
MTTRYGADVHNQPKIHIEIRLKTHIFPVHLPIYFLFAMIIIQNIKEAVEKYITDERTGLRYELVGDYYIIAGDNEPEEEQEPIGIWGQRHLRYLKEHHRVRYGNLLTSGKMNAYLADIDRQAEELFLRLVKQMADADGITEKLKACDQMKWVGRMNSIRDRVTEIVNNELILI